MVIPSSGIVTCDPPGLSRSLSFSIHEGLFQELLSTVPFSSARRHLPVSQRRCSGRPPHCMRHHKCRSLVAQHHAPAGLVRWTKDKEGHQQRHLGQNTLLCPQLHRLLEDDWCGAVPASRRRRLGGGDSRWASVRTFQLPRDGDWATGARLWRAEGTRHRSRTVEHGFVTAVPLSAVSTDGGMLETGLLTKQSGRHRGVVRR